LEVNLGARLFLLVQAVAVFPRVEPALTIYLGERLLWRDQPLLDDKRLLQISRLPWFRAGYMPDWIRLALVRRLDKDRINRILELLQTFPQPIENPRTGAVYLDIGRRTPDGFRKLLLSWIQHDRTGVLEDRILVDALSGRDPQELGVPIPGSLANRLRRLFRSSDAAIVAFGVATAALVWLMHNSFVAGLSWIWIHSYGPWLLNNVGTAAIPLLRIGWILLGLALGLFWRFTLGIDPSAANDLQRLLLPLGSRLNVPLAMRKTFAAAVIWLCTSPRYSDSGEPGPIRLPSALAGMAGLLGLLVFTFTQSSSNYILAIPAIALMLAVLSVLVVIAGARWPMPDSLILTGRLLSSSDQGGYRWITLGWLVALLLCLVGNASLLLEMNASQIFGVMFCVFEGLSSFFMYRLVCDRTALRMATEEHLRNDVSSSALLFALVFSAGQALLPLALVGLWYRGPAMLNTWLIAFGYVIFRLVSGLVVTTTSLSGRHFLKLTNLAGIGFVFSVVFVIGLSTIDLVGHGFHC
jgi:hypothetical protein